MLKGLGAAVAAGVLAFAGQASAAVIDGTVTFDGESVLEGPLWIYREPGTGLWFGNAIAEGGSAATPAGTPFVGLWATNATSHLQIFSVDIFAPSGLTLYANGSGGGVAAFVAPAVNAWVTYTAEDMNLGAFETAWLFSFESKDPFRIDNFSYAAVPEPATWAMMIGGLGAAGAMLRRRRAVLA